LGAQSCNWEKRRKENVIIEEEKHEINYREELKKDQL
jgi:hypothetical protein